jgi:DNA-nicking Smr family endonuclease
MGYLMRKLDLHGTKHADVRRKVIRFIEANWNCGEEVEIITGNSYEMKKLVTSVVSEYDLTYRMPYFDIESGCLRIMME